MTLGLYSLLLRLALPFALLRLYWRSLRNPPYRQGIGERLAWSSPAPPSEVWLHAVSVGEVQAAERLIRHLLDRDGSKRVLVTTTTPTGATRLRQLFGDTVSHRYTPYDLPGILSRFLDQVQPRLVIVMETEIWPNLLAACKQREIPTLLANARLSQRSARGYARLQDLTRTTLGRFDLIAAQTDADAARFVELGAAPERVRVTGSLKFDLRPSPTLRDQTDRLRRIWGAQRPVWVAASTHEGEEQPLLQVHRQVRAQIPKALLVLVPRHPERFDRVADLVQRQDLSLSRRSRRQACGEEVAVFLGDTMGELPLFLAAADAAFIGGSLVPVGGHNPLEAAVAGVPLAVGPHTFNFAAIVELLIAEGAAARIPDPDALAERIASWLADPGLRARMGDQGRRVVERNRGALERLVRLIDERLFPAARPGSAT